MAEVTCTYCNAIFEVMDDDWQFCPYCGKEIDEAEEDEEKENGYDDMGTY